MTVATQDPSRDVRDRIADASNTADYVDKIWFHKTAAAVIDADRCVQCGACVAACPSNSIGVAEDLRPTLIRMCTGCSFCWDVCPVGGLRVERLWRLAESGAADPTIGQVTASYAAKARRDVPDAQDGGVATAILARLLEDGFIDGVILSRKGPPAGGVAMVARTASEVVEGAGSVYNSVMTLAALSGLRGKVGPTERLALVGTPCQISALRAMQRYPWPYCDTPADQVVLTIGLFCTRSFDLPRLQVLFARRGIDPATVARIDVSDGDLTAFDGDGGVLVRESVHGFDDAALGGCAECADSTARLADISLGSIGSAAGLTTALIRTRAGAEAWERAQPALSSESLDDPAAVRKFARGKRRRALATLKRPFDAEKRLLVTYSEHLAAYSGTDRAPVTPPGYRSHHYLISC